MTNNPEEVSGAASIQNITLYKKRTNCNVGDNPAQVTQTPICYCQTSKKNKRTQAHKKNCKNMIFWKANTLLGAMLPVMPEKQQPCL
ncbi:hypothetical protein CDAR_368921 [Caerostris darwini]|uniref:Uncharacterized protein n=1 Tax=Caerostris darwini TaxID=1538125 RepID=A0AAV4NIQ7_9ARAC|nr:hypothetical protein CDAR_368921 [Caerostris darwini]